MWLLGGCMMRRIKGFTLVEIVVTVAIFAIVAMIAMPSIGHVANSQRYKRDTQELISKIKEVRTYALVHRQAATLTLDDDSVDEPPAFYWKPNSNASLKTSTDNEIKFNAQGYLSSAFDEVELCRDSDTSTIISFTALGKIHHVESGNCT